MALSVNLRSRREGEVLIVSVSGVVTADTPNTIRAYTAGLLHSQDARAVVADLRCATLALSVDDWAGPADAVAGAHVQVAPPVALVVSPECKEAARAYARRMRERGHDRDVFVSFSRAFEWAASRLDHWSVAPSSRDPSQDRPAACLPGSQRSRSLPPAARVGAAPA